MVSATKSRQMPTAKQSKRGSYKPKALVEKAGALYSEGQSNREIGRQLGVDCETVPRMLEKSEILKEYRSELMKRVPKALENLDMLLAPGMGQSVEELGRTTRWVLENTQVGIKKEGLEVTEPKKEVWELSTEEPDREIAELVRHSGYRLVPLEADDQNVGTEVTPQPETEVAGAD